MAAPMEEFCLESVRVYILGKGGQVTNQEIARHFKRFLKDPSRPELKAQFKDYVNTVAVVKKVNEQKLITLRKDYTYPPLTPYRIQRTPPSQSPQRTPLQRTPPQRSSSSLDALDFINNDVFYDPQPLGLPIDPPENPLNHSQSSPNISSVVDSDCVDGKKSPLPTAPPRRKSNKDKNGKARAPQPPLESTPKNEINESGEENLQTPRLSVKEQAQKLNKIASQSQLNLKPQNPQAKRKENISPDDDDDDSSSIAPSDPKCREWLLKCAQVDYLALTRLLRDEPRLVRHKDIIYGYTALHWAAKHGDCNVVKLIAGTHGLDVNIRSGYTPLHLSAIHNHRNVYNLLIETYNADAHIRDYSGKKAHQLFKDAKKTNIEGKNERRKESDSAPPTPTSSSWTRSAILSMSMRDRTQSTERRRLFMSMRGRKARPVSYV